MKFYFDYLFERNFFLEIAFSLGLFNLKSSTSGVLLKFDVLLCIGIFDVEVVVS